jgi:hypothetical protein
MEAIRGENGIKSPAKANFFTFLKKNVQNYLQD